MKYTATKENLAIEDGGPVSPETSSVWQWLQHGVSIDRSATAFVAVHKTPDHLSCLLPDGLKDTRALESNNHFKWTYEQLEAAALNVAAYLHSRGIGPGDVVSTFVENSVEWAILFWACIRLGVAFSPMDLRELNHPEELQYQMSVTGTTVAVVTDATAANAFDANATQIPPMKVKFICSPLRAGINEWTSLPDIPADSDPGVLPPTSTHRASDTCLTQFTSGTTSRPKGVALHNAAFVYGIDGYRQIAHGRFDASMRFILTTTNFRPLYQIGSFCAWRSGGCVVLSDTEYEVGSVLKATVEQEVTHLFSMKAQIKELTQHEDFEKWRPKSLRFVNITGDVTDRGMLEETREKLRAELVLSIWGMTEGTGVIAWGRRDDSVLYTMSEGLTGVGRVLPGSVIKICQAEVCQARTPIARGQAGSLHVSSANFIRAYVHGRDPETFYTDDSGRHWFIPGDTAMMDEKGIIYILGRSKEIIKVAGVGLSPGAIEALLIRHSGIGEAVAFGIPHEDYGSVPVAVVKASDAGKVPTLQELNEIMLRERTKEYELAGVYELHDLGFQAWPVNSSGKIVKKELKKAVVRRMLAKGML